MRTLALVALLLPQHGVLVPGKSLGGIRLGATPKQVERAWGRFHGTCRNCAQRTWYFTHRQPPGWRTSRGLALGDASAQVTALYGILPQTPCNGYVAYTLTGRNSVTAFYVAGDSLWGFGLMRPPVPVCR